MVPRRVDKRAVVAKEALIRAAEKLFGDYGVDAVSMRQIVSAAGLSNNFAVQYHFGDKSGLIDAIFERRLATLEKRRGDLLQAAIRRGVADNPRVLAEMLYRPVTEMRDETGRRTYAAFLLALQQSADDYWYRYQYISRAPVAREIKDRLTAAAAHVPASLLQARRLSAAAVVFSGLVQRDRQGRNLGIDDQLIDDAITAAVSVITAPVPAAFRAVAAGAGVH